MPATVRNRMQKLFMILCLSVIVGLNSNLTYAVENPDLSSGGALSPREKVASIIYMGLGGAILGLSTLSFYPRPQDRLSHIAVGFALGIITGTVYTTYSALKFANNKSTVSTEFSTAFYDLGPTMKPSIDVLGDFETSSSKRLNEDSSLSSLSKVSLQFTF